MVDRRGVSRILVRKSEVEDPGVDERIILKWIFRKWEVVWYRLDRAGSG
jgi:hypothetical protein